MKSSRLSRMFNDNRGLKLVSLLIALVLWARVVGSEGAEGHFQVSLVLTNIPKGLVLVDHIPESLGVRLAGPRAIMSTLDERKLSFTLDLTGLQEGATSFELNPSKLDLPRGVEVTQLSPSKILIQADRRIKKRVAVNPRLSGVPAQGFAIASAVPDPGEVEVEGAERYVKPLKEISTEIIDVSGISENFDRDVDVAVYDPAIKPTDKKRVHLEVRVREVNIERVFARIPVIPPSPKWSVKPATVDVRLAGVPSQLSAIGPDDIEARAFTRGQSTPRGPVQVVVSAPRDTRFVSSNPPEVTLVPAPRQ